MVVGLPVLRGARPELAAAIAFAGFMLVNKTFSPQYMLWVLVFAIIADWPAWTFAMLAGAGLVDFANAMIVLHLASVHDPAYSWYRNGFYNVNRAIRLGSIGVALAAGFWHGHLPSGSGKTPPIPDVPASVPVVPASSAGASAGFA